MNRLSMPEPLTSEHAVVRELYPSDAALVAEEAARGLPKVRGRIAVPATAGEALVLLTEFEVLREEDRANLFGVFRPREGSLAGVVSVRLDPGEDFVGEAACWNQDRERSREVTAAGVGLITSYAHTSMKIMRLWVDVDPLDQFAKYLGMVCGYTADRKPQPGSTAKVRYSSIG